MCVCGGGGGGGGVGGGRKRLDITTTKTKFCGSYVFICLFVCLFVNNFLTTIGYYHCQNKVLWRVCFHLFVCLSVCEQLPDHNFSCGVMKLAGLIAMLRSGSDSILKGQGQGKGQIHLTVTEASNLVHILVHEKPHQI